MGTVVHTNDGHSQGQGQRLTDPAQLYLAAKNVLGLSLRSSLPSP